MLSVGSPAPDFELKSHSGETVKLSDFAGTPVVVAFHPLAFTGICAVQMQDYEKEKPQFEALGAHVLGLSIDPVPSKKAWAESLGGISFDLLSDFHPKGAVAKAYGVMLDDKGISGRAVFIVHHGKIAWARQYEIPEQPDVNDVIGALKSLA